MRRNTTILLTALFYAMMFGSARSATTATQAWVTTNVKTPLLDNQKQLRDLLTAKDENGNWVMEFETDAAAAIPAINELHSEMAGKQDVITVENPLAVEKISGLAEVATTGSYDSLSDKPEIPSTDNLATKGELQALQTVVGNAESGLVKVVADNTAAIADKADTSALETAVADLEEKIDNAVIDSSNIDLSSYAKTEDVAKTYATNATVEAIDGRVGVLEGAGYQNAQQVQGAITSATADFVTEAELGAYAKTETVDAELAKKVNAADLKALAYKNTVATADIDDKSVTIAKIKGEAPAAVNETLLLSVDADGNATWLSVEILK